MEPGGDGQGLYLLRRPFTEVSSQSFLTLKLPVLSDVMVHTYSLSL